MPSPTSPLSTTSETELPALSRLRLSNADYQALARQGFVARETRGTRTYFKLRFRRAGKQIVRYLGSQAQLSAQVEQELKQLQRERRSQRTLRQLSLAAMQDAYSVLLKLF